jgi:hypothetical protein
MIRSRLLRGVLGRTHHEGDRDDVENDKTNEVSSDHMGTLGKGVGHGQKAVAPAAQNHRHTESAEPGLRPVPDNRQKDAYKHANIRAVDAENDSVWIQCDPLHLVRSRQTSERL